MKLLADDGYLRPNVQVALGAALAVLFLGEGIDTLLSPSKVNVFFGCSMLVGVPVCVYVAWYAYRKMKKGEGRLGSGQSNGRLSRSGRL